MRKMLLEIEISSRIRGGIMSAQGSAKIVESNRRPEPGEAYGVAGLTQKLQGISFPISKEELLEQYGKEQFQWTKEGESLTLNDCLQSLSDEIQSITEITEAVSSNQN
jgi:hypothetical protein